MCVYGFCKEVVGCDLDEYFRYILLMRNSFRLIFYGWHFGVTIDFR